jgi:PIN domain nuclease of toxin-antitoxin system
VNILLDTHAFLCLSEDASLLGRRGQDLIDREDSRVFLSLCSIWEMAIKLKLGKLELDVSLEKAVDAGVDAGLRILGLKKEAIYRTLSLDLAHRDPFDRILAAQALTEDMVFLSRNAAVDIWDVHRVW